jgi:stage IV sporulation protein FB
MSNEKSLPAGQTSFRLEISGGFLLLLSFSAFLCGAAAVAEIAAAAAVHELGHLAVILAQGALPRRLRLDISGASLDCAGPEPDLRGELLRASAGPLAGLVLWFSLQLSGTEALMSMGKVSLLLSLTNLLPACGLDGERMLRCLRRPPASALEELLPGLLSSALLTLLGLRFSPQLLLFGLWLLFRAFSDQGKIDFRRGIVYDDKNPDRRKENADASGTGSDPAEGAEAGPLYRRGIRRDHKKQG